MKKFILLICIQSLMLAYATAQVWNPNLDDGEYKNPIIFADYSDPDVIRVGDDFYMVSSSFNCMPGIPILHSKDLVNWEIINHVYQRLPLQKWIGAKVGLFCINPNMILSKGYANFDWFVID